MQIDFKKIASGYGKEFSQNIKLDINNLQNGTYKIENKTITIRDYREYISAKITDQDRVNFIERLITHEINNYDVLFGNNYLNLDYANSIFMNVMDKGISNRYTGQRLREVIDKAIQCFHIGGKPMDEKIGDYSNNIEPCVWKKSARTYDGGHFRLTSCHEYYSTPDKDFCFKFCPFCSNEIKLED